MPPRRAPARRAAAAAAAPPPSPPQAQARGKRKRQAEEQHAEKEEEEEEEEEEEDDEGDEDDEDGEEGEEDEGELVVEGATRLVYAESQRLHYEGALRADVKHGRGKLFFPDGSTLEGEFVDDEISGMGTYTGSDGSRIVGRYVEGELDGEVAEYDEHGLQVFRGQYQQSVRHGPGTLTSPDGGQLQGEFVEGQFEGEDNRYLYPHVPALGGRISLRGEWKEGVMVRARAFLDETPLEDADTTYTFDESTRTRISRQPLLADPYESRVVYAKQSAMPNSGEGLFARVDLPADTVVSWYNGTRHNGQVAERRRWADNSNTILLIDDCPSGQEIDIDVSAKWSSLDAYCASIAHKCNTAFDRSQFNSKYDLAMHPRFGLIKSIRTTRAVWKDEELFVDYGYTVKVDENTGRVKGNSGPEWLRKGLQEFLQQQMGSNKSVHPAARRPTKERSAAATASASSGTRRSKRLKQ